MSTSDIVSTISVAITPLLVDAEALARMLGISKRSVYNMHADGTLGPLPVSLGSRKLWRTEEVSRWVAAGCPRRELWIEKAEK